jgi:glutathione S-transferase
VPFIIRPISSAIANKVINAFVFPNAKKHLAFIDNMLKTGPSTGKYLCGPEITAADILMSYPLIAAKTRFSEMGSWEGGSAQTAFPKVFEYIERLEATEGFKNADAKLKEFESKKDSKLA